MTTFAAVAGAVVALPAAAATALVVGIRRRDPRAVGMVTRWQRSKVNPAQLETAGRAGARTSVVRHRGRRSGRHYATPVGVTEVGDALVVLLPYGPGADWVRNVRASGGADVEHDGHTVEVTSPEVVPLDEVASALGTGDRVAAALFGIREALRLHPVE